MEQSPAIWLIIVLSLFTANLPFIMKGPLLVLPWAHKGEPDRPVILRWLESLIFFALVYAVGRVGYEMISTSLIVFANAMSIAAFYGKLAAYVVVLGALMFYPAWRSRRHNIKKSFVVRLIELFVLYLVVGVLAFALELNLGNRFEQTWEFYAITGSLFLVLGYPGFVFRYLMKRSKKSSRPRRSTPVADAATASGAVNDLKPQEPAGA